MSNIYFISGIHGVGKTTLCKLLQKELTINHYSCSDLIKQNSCYIEESKVVINADKNQNILLDALGKLDESIILLDGHFCLIGREEDIIKLNHDLFKSIAPKVIINVTCHEEEIRKRLLKRDGRCLSIEKLRELQKAESSSAIEISNQLQIPIYQYESGEQLNTLLEHLQLPSNIS